jgi:hypothetical protein
VTKEERQHRIVKLRLLYELLVDQRAKTQREIEDVRDELEELGVLP